MGRGGRRCRRHSRLLATPASSGGTTSASRRRRSRYHPPPSLPRPRRRHHLQCARWGRRSATNKAATGPQTAEARAVAVAQAEAGVCDGGGS
uniref:Uncharacterized protein n=1 Tax=Oryza glaberrima TaxID=4538 RepID=I1P0W7_ORYGL